MAIKGKDQGIFGQNLILTRAIRDHSLVPNSRMMNPKKIAFIQMGILRDTQKA